MIAILRQRDFSLLWFGGVLSFVGDYLLFIALPFYIYDLTGSVLATGVMFIAQTLPRLLFGSVAGVFVDRWDRKRTMVIADLSRALVLLPLVLVPLLAVQPSEWLWLIYVVAALEATISQFFIPAKNAIIPSLVGERHLAAANSLNSLGEEVPSLIGALLGGALLAPLGLSGLVLLDLATYLLSGAMISLIVATSVPPAASSATATARSAASALAGVWRELAEGLRVVTRDTGVTVVFAVIAVAMLGEGVLAVMLIVFVGEVLQGSELEFSWLVTCLGVGGIIGSLLIGWMSTVVRQTHLLALSMGVDGVVLLAMFNFPSLPLVLALAVLAGMSVVGTIVAAQTLLQSWVQDRYLGRVFGAYETTQALLLLGGMGLAVVLGELLGVLPLLNIAGVLYVLAGVAAWFRLPGDK